MRTICGRLVALFLAVFITVGVTFAQTTPPTTPPTQGQGQQTAPVEDKLTVEQKKEILDRVAELLNTRVYVTGVDLSKWPEHLAKHQENIDKAENSRQFTTAVNRAFREFGFSHMNLRTPRAAEQRRIGPVAVGFGIQAEKEGDGLVVRAVTPESPAAKAGIEVGDVIILVDGKAPESNTVLGGEAGAASKISVKKKSGETKDVELQRQQFSTARKDTLSWPDEESAVLRVNSFSRGYEQANIEKLMQDAAKAKYLVLDLRSNGGGQTNNLRHLLSLLLPADSTIGAFISRDDAKAYAEKNGGEAKDPIKIAEFKDRKYKTFKAKVEPFKGKIAVLTNRGSASASEITAAALREVAGAPLVGTRTAGAVLASIYGRLPHGYELQYPINDYVTAKGIRLEGNPLLPDAEVTERVEGENDPVLKKALELLKAKV